MGNHNDILSGETALSNTLDVVDQANGQLQSNTSTPTARFGYLGNFSSKPTRSYARTGLDIFLDESMADLFLENCAMQKIPGPEHRDKVSVYDLLVSEPPGKPSKLRPSWNSWEIKDLVQSDDTNTLIRMIFIESDSITTEGLRELSRHYSIPTRFWGSNSNGDFGHRTSKPSLDEVMHNTWLEILTKPVNFHDESININEGIFWYRPCFSFKWQCCGPGSKHRYKTTIFCLDSSRYVQEYLAKVMSQEKSQLILRDPYYFYCLISTQWYNWNLDACFGLRGRLVEIENRYESIEVEFEPDFPTLHRLSRDIIQMTEVSQSAIFVMEHLSLSHEHEFLYPLFDGSRDVYFMVSAFLNERLMLFRGTLSSYEALSQRITNLTNFAFNVVAQRDSKISVQIGKATQSDSNSMRSIAIVTLIFLPGTAIASIFSTPFFDYNSSHAPFWLYWALTIPATAAVFMIWYIFGREERLWVSISNSFRERWRRIMPARPRSQKQKLSTVLPK